MPSLYFSFKFPFEGLAVVDMPLVVPSVEESGEFSKKNVLKLSAYPFWIG